jgi:hypothetical protein
MGHRLCDLVIENAFVRNTMLHSYTDPVAKLLTYSGVDERSPKDQWPDYRELGLTEEHIPDLIRMATDLDLHNLRQESPEVWAPLHAWRALAQLRAVEAVNPLVLLFEQLKDDDWLPEELPTVFSMIGPGAIPTLERFLADDGVEEIGRISVPACLVRMAQDHPDDRDTCVGVLVRQLEKFETNGPALNGFLIIGLIDLGATQAIGLIRQAFSENQVDLSILGDVEDAEIEMGLRTNRSTPRPRLDLLGHPLDVDSFAGDAVFDDAIRKFPVRHAVKVGRNDPCPCGSGKKFKKCCLH